METENTQKPENPRMHNPDGVYASEARLEDYFSLRDHFAGLAMQSLITKIELTNDEVLLSDTLHRFVPVLAYQLAGAMLLQRQNQ